jgi:histidyl-tRNA synthetase
MLGLTRVRLQINSLGTSESRKAYRTLLQDYFRAHLDALDEDGKRRLEGNPLRILDSKHPPTQAIVGNAPVLTDHLDDESKEHFAQFRAGLDSLGIAYTVNPRLVRGLDYYSRTVFEWTTDALGSQDAICSGGRYDGLSPRWAVNPPRHRLPGRGTRHGARPAGRADSPDQPPDVFVMAQGDAAQRAALGLAEICATLCRVAASWSIADRLFKTRSAFLTSDAAGTDRGDDELARGVIALAVARAGAPDRTPVAELTARVEEF